MKISVIITSYNHEKYIAQCVDSILAQKGDFEMEIVVGDDCSRDRTGAILEGYRQKHPNLIRILHDDKNLGITRNLKRCLDACTGEFIAICEGDDYWTDPYKLQKQSQYLRARPDFAMCFSTLNLYYEAENKFVLFEDQLKFPRDEVNIHDLIKNNLIGNFSCCMYRTKAVRKLSPRLFEFFTVDWMFNMAISQIGRIGYIRESLSVYRKHDSGAWTGKTQVQQATELLILIDTYNHFLQYRYNADFLKNKQGIEDWARLQFSDKDARRMMNEAAVRSPYPPPPLDAPLPEENFEEFEPEAGDLPNDSDPLAESFEQAEWVEPAALVETEEPSPVMQPAVMDEVDQPASTPVDAPALSAHSIEVTAPVEMLSTKQIMITKFKNTFRPYWRALIRFRNLAIPTLILTRSRIRQYLRERIYLAKERVIVTQEKIAIARARMAQSRGKPIIWREIVARIFDVPSHARALVAFVKRQVQRVHDYWMFRGKFYDTDLLILDTVFPHPRSPFRFHEFHHYLESFPKSKVFTNGEHLSLLSEHRGADVVVKEYSEAYPKLRERVYYAKEAPSFIHGKLAYATFLNNIKRFVDVLEGKNIPFVFTLYPGGGFQIDQEESDSALRRVMGSPQFRKVIVTQKLTYDYLIKKKFCPADKIEFIYGVVTPPMKAKNGTSPKKHYGFEKYILDVCFVAYKYTPRGVDKGYDVFIDVARNLVRMYGDVQFHVVGNFDETDLPVHDLGERLKFYGVQKREWFDSFFADKDIILSPNIPYVLQKGAFDGFPTSACTDAGLREVAILCTDDLCQNIMFKDQEEIVLIPHDSQQITEIIAHYHDNPYALRDLAQKGAERMREIYSDDIQLKPRKKILEAELRRVSH